MSEVTSHFRKKFFYLEITANIAACNLQLWSSPTKNLDYTFECNGIIFDYNIYSRVHRLPPTFRYQAYLFVSCEVK